MNIDATTARDLIEILQLGQETGEAKISWALGIIHQIPGYEKTGFAKAAGDRVLIEQLIVISRQEIPTASPKDLGTLIEKAQAQEIAGREARQKGEKIGKEFTEKTAEAAKKKVSLPKTEKVSLPKAEAPSVREPVLAVALTKIVGSKETAGFLQKVVFAPIKILIEGTTPVRGGGSSALATSAIVRGITPSKLLPLKSQALSLGFSEKQFEKFVAALSKRKFLVSLSDAVNVGRELSISPTQTSALFLKPSADKSSISVFRKSFLDRLFGGLREGLFGKPRGVGEALGKNAASHAASGTRDIFRFLSGNAGRGSAQWGWAAAGGLAAGGLALSGASPVLAAGLFAGAAGTSLAAGANQSDGYGKLFGDGIGKTIAFIAALFTLTISGIITAIVIGMIATIGTVAIILFIINSGAYVVPAQQNSFLSYLESPYISLTKTASVTGSVENNALPITVTYRVTIDAKKGDLVLKSISDNCAVSQKSGSTSCPETEGFPNQEDFPSDISGAGEAYQFSYRRTFTDGDQDSLVHDTITVVADAPEQAGATAQASASFAVGEPPTQCFKVLGDNWPSNFRANVEAGIVAIVSKHPTFAAKVCSGGEVGIGYSAEVKDYWGYHNHGRDGTDVDVILYSGGITNALNAEYILTHEVSHHLQAIMPQLQSQYMDGESGARISSERPLCSYSATVDPWEGFPEGNALYGSGKPLSSFGRCSGVSGDFQSVYPNHWRFAKGVIFGE